MDDAEEDLNPTRESLLGRLKNWDDQESWRDFFNTYWRLIYAAAVKSGLSDAEAQDVVQDTVITVAKKMEEFTYDPAVDSFKGWLLYLTRKRIALQYRRRERDRGRTGAEAGGVDGRPAIEEIPDPSGIGLEAIWDEEWERSLWNVAIVRIKDQVAPKQFQMFQAYVLKELPAVEVARTFNVTVAQVYLAKHRISTLLQKELLRLQRGLIA